MNQKACPQCGFPADVNAPQCSRCQHVYRTNFANQTQMIPAQQWQPQPQLADLRESTGNRVRYRLQIACIAAGLSCLAVAFMVNYVVPMAELTLSVLAPEISGAIGVIFLVVALSLAFHGQKPHRMYPLELIVGLLVIGTAAAMVVDPHLRNARARQTAIIELAREEKAAQDFRDKVANRQLTGQELCNALGSNYDHASVLAILGEPHIDGGYLNLSYFCSDGLFNVNFGRQPGTYQAIRGQYAHGYLPLTPEPKSRR